MKSTLREICSKHPELEPAMQTVARLGKVQPETRADDRQDSVYDETTLLAVASQHCTGGIVAVADSLTPTGGESGASVRSAGDDYHPGSRIERATRYRE